MPDVHGFNPVVEAEFHAVFEAEFAPERQVIGALGVFFDQFADVVRKKEMQVGMRQPFKLDARRTLPAGIGRKAAQVGFGRRHFVPAVQELGIGQRQRQLLVALRAGKQLRVRDASGLRRGDQTLYKRPLSYDIAKSHPFLNYPVNKLTKIAKKTVYFKTTPARLTV